MAQYRYMGPGPHDDGQGGLVRPGDVWEWPAEPDWGPWEPVGDGAESDPPAPPVPAPTPEAGSPAAASTDPGTEG